MPGRARGAKVPDAADATALRFMVTKPIVTSPLFKWEGLGAYPLRLAADGDPQTPEIELIGELPAGGAYGYSFRLQPGVVYRFADLVGDSDYQAFLSNRETGDLLWANPAGLDAVGSALVAPATIEVGAATTLTLVLRSPADRQLPFSVQIFADEVAISDTAVYRFTDVQSGQFFYTGSEDERDAVFSALPQMRYDGPVFYAGDQPRDGLIPVYRFFDPSRGAHFYTASEAERAHLQATTPNWNFEGPAFFVPAAASEDTLPVYRLANFVTGAHVYTIVPAEKAFLLLQGDWRDEGVAFLSSPSADDAATPAGAGMPGPVEIGLIGVGELLPDGPA
jgi:hypothetical protein